VKADAPMRFVSGVCSSKGSVRFPAQAIVSKRVFPMHHFNHEESRLPADEDENTFELKFETHYVGFAHSVSPLYSDLTQGHYEVSIPVLIADDAETMLEVKSDRFAPGLSSFEDDCLTPSSARFGNQFVQHSRSDADASMCI
jgi:hypothetical protein